MGGHGANRPVKKRKPREQTDKVVKYMGTWEVRRLEEDKLRKIQEKLDNIEKTVIKVKLAFPPRFHSNSVPQA